MPAQGAAKFDALAGSRVLGCIVALALALAGCSSGSTAPSPGTTGTSQPVQASPPSGSPPTAPSKHFTDAELVALINAVARNRGLPYSPAQDSSHQRSGAGSGALPQVSTETTPRECIAFIPQNPFTIWADRDISFGEGAMPPTGGESGPTTTIMITLRSAGKDAIATADFGYTDDMLSRCSQFDVASTEAGRTSTSTIQLLAAPPIADKQHGLIQNTKPKGPSDYGSVGLRVLAGTLSITLSLAVANLNSESDAKPALESMAGLAKELISQAVNSPPSVPPPPPNAMTADQMVALFKDIPGPNGDPITLPGASVIGPAPGATATTGPQPPQPPCSFNDETYFASLVGSLAGQAQITGATKQDYTEFMAVNMSSEAVTPYPFDTRAANLKGCTSIKEDSFGGNSREWSPVTTLEPGLPADASYAVAYQLSDGTGEWHVRSGARRGTLTLEANTRTASQADAQATADRLAAFFAAVFAKAGK